MKQFELQPLKTPPIVWNFDEIKVELENEMRKFKGLVYTDDNIKEAKKDRALLNKVVKELNDKKVAVKKEYCAPLEVFENQVKELQAIVNDVNAEIDGAVKEYEERKRAEKAEQIKEAFATIFADIPKEITLEMIENPKWMNASVTMKEVEDNLKAKAIMIREDLAYIDRMDATQRLAVRFDYLRTLSLSTALNLNRERQDFEAANTPQKAEKSADAYEITLRIVVTDESLDDLLVYLKANGIELIL